MVLWFFCGEGVAEVVCHARLEWLAKADYIGERWLIVVVGGCGFMWVEGCGNGGGMWAGKVAVYVC